MAQTAKKSATKSSGKSATKAAPVAKKATKAKSTKPAKTDTRVEAQAASVDTKAAAPINREKAKQQRFDKIGVPKARRGENLHEQNPDLQAAISRSKIL